jgi:hypothetical protein
MGTNAIILKSKPRQEKIARIGDFRSRERVFPLGNGPFHDPEGAVCALASDANRKMDGMMCIGRAIISSIPSQKSKFVGFSDASAYEIMSAGRIADHIENGKGVTEEEFFFLATAIARNLGYPSRASYIYTSDPVSMVPALSILARDGLDHQVAFSEYSGTPVAIELLDDEALMSLLYLNSVLRMIGDIPNALFTTATDLEKEFHSAVIGHAIDLSLGMWNCSESDGFVLIKHGEGSLIRTLGQRYDDLMRFLIQKEPQVDLAINNLCPKIKVGLDDSIPPGLRSPERLLSYMDELRKPHQDDGCDCLDRALALVDIIERIPGHMHKKNDCKLNEKLC